MLKTKQNQQLNKLLVLRALKRYSGQIVGLLVVTSVAFFGVHVLRDSNAATGGTLYISPASASQASGSTFTVAIHETSGTNPVNAVQASLLYNASQLQFVSITEGSVFTNAAATNTATAGTIRLARGTPSSTSVTGDQTVVSVTFKMLATSGSTSLSFDNAFSNIALAADNTNMLSATTGATFTVPAATSGTLSMQPATGTYTAGSTVAVQIHENSGTTLVNAVQAEIDFDATKLQFVNITEGSIFTNAAATDTATAGRVRLARGTTSTGTATGVTGDNLVSTVNFKVIATAASTASSTYSSSFSFIAKSSDNTNVLTASNGASYQLTMPAPTISSVTPTSGPTTGGTVVTITGTNFVSGATVSVDGLAATGVTFVSATSLKATMPSHAAGSATFVVTNPGGQTATKAAAYTYVASAPAITSVSPTTVSTLGGSTVTITGTNFVNGARVTVGGTAATSVTFNSAASLTAVVPAHTAGAATVVVTNPDGQSAQFTGFTYIAPNTPGDVNGDGRVNAIDLSLLISHDGQNYPAADFNLDGTVGSADLAIMLAHWTW